MKRGLFARLADWWSGLPWGEPTPEERREAQELLASIRQPKHAPPSFAVHSPCILPHSERAAAHGSPVDATLPN